MIDSLTDDETMQLRNVLGFEDNYANEEDFQSLFGDSLENMPNLHIIYWGFWPGTGNSL